MKRAPIVLGNDLKAFLVLLLFVLGVLVYLGASA